MSTTRGRQPGREPDFGPGHFAGWPATVSVERLERAIKFVQESARDNPPLTSLPKSGNPDFDRDIFMTAQSMLSPRLANRIDLSVLDQFQEEDMLIALTGLLSQAETLDHFACAIINDQNPSRPDLPLTIEIRHVFTMAKHPD